MTTPDPLPPLASATDYANLVGTPPKGVDLDQLLAAASDTIRRSCGWVICPQVSETVTVDGSGGHEQMLPTMFLVDVTSVTDAGTVVDPLDLEWSRSGYMRRAGCWTCKLRGVVVEMTHGYESVPAGLKKLCCDMVARAAAAPAAIRSEQVGSVSLTYAVSLMQHEVDYLASYRLPGAP